MKYSIAEISLHFFRRQLKPSLNHAAASRQARGMVFTAYATGHSSLIFVITVLNLQSIKAFTTPFDQSGNMHLIIRVFTICSSPKEAFKS